MRLRFPAALAFAALLWSVTGCTVTGLGPSVARPARSVADAYRGPLLTPDGSRRSLALGGPRTPTAAFWVDRRDRPRAAAAGRSTPVLSSAVTFTVDRGPAPRRGFRGIGFGLGADGLRTRTVRRAVREAVR